MNRCIQFFYTGNMEKRANEYREVIFHENNFLISPYDIYV